MAIKLEFYNVIVPVNNLREKLGNKAFESRFATITTTVTWHDNLLFRDGCMNPWDLAEMIDE